MLNWWSYRIRVCINR